MRRIILLTLLFITTQLFAESVTISDYQRTYVPVYNKDGVLVIAIRMFKRNNVPSFLIVNTQSLKTSVYPMTQIYLQAGKNRGRAAWQIASTRYSQLLERHSSRPYKIQNYGVTHGEDHLSGHILTIDLCPSTAVFEKDFFKQIAALSDKGPVPIAISVSGMWLLMHKAEFNYLLSLQQENKLDITWINHSFSHPYYSDLPYPENFLLSKMVNEESEILLTEQYLLEANQVPSVFFRFPGLISNKKLIMKLKEFGLLALGADAWIAKHESISPGSIILVHGNGNEHDGIVTLSPMLKQLNLLSINNSI
jgi:peptidoglycan/xylan/chitin deacetylase (PgdA/CDA1 family)